MLTQKNMFKLGLIVERIHRLAFDVALAASELGEYGKGVAILADETRYIGIRLYSLFDSEEMDPNITRDILEELRYLSVNGNFEIMRLHESQVTLRKRLTVIFDEIRSAVVDMEKLVEISATDTLLYPKIAPVNTVSNEYCIFAAFTINGLLCCESVGNVEEALRFSEELLEGDQLKVRDAKLPILNGNLLPNAKYKTALIVSSNYGKNPKRYALLVDELPLIVGSRGGVSAKPSHAKGEMIRECWRCEEDRELLFLDYDQVATKGFPVSI